MGWKNWLVLPLALATACSVDDEPKTATETSAVTGSNGVWENGLTSNGLIMNGVWENGVWENGVWENGVWENGVWENGVWENGVWENGVWENGVWENGVWENGVWENGVWENGVWENGVWENGVYHPSAWEQNLRAQTILRENDYTQQVLQYLYSCAMPAGAHKTMTVKDPTGQQADLVIQLDGGIGLWPTWGEQGSTCDGDCATKLTQWKADMAADGVTIGDTGQIVPGTCGDAPGLSCQRWVSACLLARTNAYGVHVEISMRAPESAPTAIKHALALVAGEDQFTKREGAYFGNIFATTPVDTTSGLFTNTPQYYACAGPISNVPQITNRFCSSQGDQAVIKVLGTCETPTGQPAVCTPPATAGYGERDCKSGNTLTNTDGLTYPEVFKEVITVYLRDPLTKCGNAVCEEGEATSCPSDCHEGDWTNVLPYSFGVYPSNFYDFGAMTAVGPDNSVVFGSSLHWETVNMGGGPLTDSNSHGILAKYAADGTYLWSKRIGQGDDIMMAPSTGIAVAADGSIGVLAFRLVLGDHIWVDKLDANGTELAGWPVELGGASSAVTPRGAPAFDAQGDVFFAASLQGTATFTLPDGDHSYTSVPAPYYPWVSEDTLVVKLSPSGQPLWATLLPGDSDFQRPEGIAVDKDGNAVVAVWGNTSVGVYKLAAGTGEILWHAPGPHQAVTVDPVTGDVFATGAYEGGYEFTSSGYRDMFVVKYASSDGHVLAVAPTPLRLCPNGGSSCSGRYDGLNIALDAGGNVVAAGYGGGNGGGVGRSTDVDFGAGRFTSYATPDVFLVAYKRDNLGFSWAKQIPMVLKGQHEALSIDSRNHIVMSGFFAGSTTVDDQLLVTPDPMNGSVVNTFITSFKAPPDVDTTPPVMADVPHDLVIQANVKQGTVKGANVFYMLPTATDSANAGTNVVCDPPPNTFFPVGTTTVTCTAYDTHGNHVSDTFTVTVKDTLGPIMFAPTIDTAPVQANTTGGAVVTYALPTAKDQLDGDVVVTCTPPSGSVFAPGTTMVVCSAQDAAGNVTKMEFPIYVEDHVDPVVTVPTATVTATATSAAGAVVTYSWSADDNTGILTKACSTPSGAVFPIGSTLVTCTAVDLGGNSVFASFTVTVADTTAPVLTVPPPISVSGTASGATVTYSTSATDYTATTTTCTPPSGSTFAVGTTTVSCTATDAAGNTTTRTFTVTVSASAPPPQPAYSWSGILQPINPDGSSAFKLGSVVPVKFTLTGASAGITNLVATLTLTKLGSTATGTDTEATSNATADSGNTFRYDATTGVYIYNLATKNLSVGDWQLSLSFGDGVSRTVKISLKK